MKKITLNDVRKCLQDMGNTYVSLLTNEELSSAVLQDDLGLEDYEIIELIEKLEAKGHFFIAEPASDFLRRQNSIPVYLLNCICNEYVYDVKQCVS